MDNERLMSIIEAVLFASGEPVSTDKIALSVDIGENIVDDIVNNLNEKYIANNSAVEILKLDNSYQLATRQEYAPYIKTALETKKNTALSPAAMEVLTVIAYNQPVTKGFVESVRGVDSSSVVNSLVEKGLLAEAGRLDLPGRPIAYKTTDNFLRCFKLTSLADLPQLPERPSDQITLDELMSDTDISQ